MGENTGSVRSNYIRPFCVFCSPNFAETCQCRATGSLPYSVKHTLGRCYPMYYAWADINSPAGATDDFFKLLKEKTIEIISAPPDFGNDTDTDIYNINQGNVTFKYEGNTYGGHINYDILNNQKPQVSVEYTCPLCNETIYVSSIKKAQEHIDNCQYRLTEFLVIQYWVYYSKDDAYDNHNPQIFFSKEEALARIEELKEAGFLHPIMRTKNICKYEEQSNATNN